MVSTHIYSGQSVEEAIESGLAELGLTKDDVEIEILEEPTKKLFGLGGVSEARVSIVAKTTDSDQGVVVDYHPEDDELDVVEIPRTTKDAHQADGEEVSDDDVDAIADAATATIKDIAALCSIENIEVEEYEGDDGELILDVVGDNLGFFIGRHGKTVDALQVVVSAIATKRSGVHYPVIVDVEGYKHRRKQKVVEIALRTAERVARTGKPLSLRPMTAQERRQVHIAIRDIAGVDTKSEGTGAYRHVVVVPVR